MSPLDTVKTEPDSMRATASGTLTRNQISNSTADQVERRIIRQLFEALLFERVINYCFDEPYFSFFLSDHHYQATGYIAGFSRIRLDQDSIQRIVNGQAQPAQLDDIIAQLPTTTSIKHKLTEQLHQTLRLCQWNAEHLPKLTSRYGLDYLDLESQLDEGHPYHPCFKARTGFSLEDHQRYGPECAHPIQLHWLAVKRPLLQQKLPQQSQQGSQQKSQQRLPADAESESAQRSNDRQFWQQELGAEAWAEIEHRLLEAELSWQEYSLLPIHPWQWHHFKDSTLKAPLQSKELVYLGAAGDDYQATISVRTLINRSHPEKAHIKLPLSMVNTSSLRKLEPHSVCTAPAISGWLKAVVRNDDFYIQHPMILLDEYAGILIPDTDEEHSWQSQMRGQLGVIFRESLGPYLQPGQQALPFTALYAIESNGLPFIHPIIQRYGLESWLKQLIDTTVIPVWHLLVKHGLGVEAHGQNMVLVHQHGWPSAVILRDFHESVEYVDAYLADPTLKPDFDTINPCYRNAPDNEYYWMSSVEALRELIIDTLFVFNLSELACVLSQHFDYSEPRFWNLIYQRLQNYAQQGHCSQERLDQMPINQQRIQTESLIKKKLADIEADHFHHRISNPFADHPPLTVLHS